MPRGRAAFRSPATRGRPSGPGTSTRRCRSSPGPASPAASCPGRSAATTTARSRRAYGTDANYERLDRARTLAAERGITVPQVALAWAFAQPLNLFALVGCESGEEFAANAGALAVRLTPEELDWLDLRRDDR